MDAFHVECAVTRRHLPGWNGPRFLQICAGLQGRDPQISTISGAPRANRGDALSVVPTDDAANSVKSASQYPGGFHRFQVIQGIRSTMSTVGLYDLYTRYGQSVDKKALLTCAENYPQVPPQPEGPLYRGFQAHKSLLKQRDNAFLHEIWLYHHHHALDLYPDLEARHAPHLPPARVWTVPFAEAQHHLPPMMIGCSQCRTPVHGSGGWKRSLSNLHRIRLDRPYTDESPPL